MPNSSTKMNVYSKTLYNSADNAQHGIACNIGSDLSQSGTGFRYFHNDIQSCRYSSQWTQLAASNKSVNNWYTLTVVFSDGLAKFYVNGILESEAVLKSSQIPTCGLNDFIVGANWLGDPRYFSGYMKDIMIYDKVLSGNEIFNLVNKCIVTDKADVLVNNEPYVFLNVDNELTLRNPTSMFIKSSIYDIQGKLVGQYETDEDFKSIKINKGVYICVLNSNGKSWTYKIIK